MDAAEHDSDVKLYKASAELLTEVQAKIPLLVRKAGTNGQIREWVLATKVYEVTSLLDRFQEWPQLLDPFLAKLVQYLVDAFLVYCSTRPQAYLHHSTRLDEVIPLPRAISSVLYAFCKVRGQKIIIRLLNNEPKYVEPMLTCFRMWDSRSGLSDAHSAGSMTWEERYIMLLWLSHLMLAPFRLTSISGLSLPFENAEYAGICPPIPSVALNLLSLAIDHLQTSSKAREAASTLIVRLALRSDMQACQLPDAILDWCIDRLLKVRDQSSTTSYHYIGLLSLLFGVMNSASDSESASYLQRTLDTAHTLATSDNEDHVKIRDQAPARKLLVKIMRSATVHAIAVSATQPHMLNGMDVDTCLEGTIQILLDFLGDKDTPVRQSASKALGLICLKLHPEMAAEVIEAVLATLDENVLLEDAESGALTPITLVQLDSISRFKKNVNAVDALKWHGSMLTLGHLLFRRSPPIGQLSAIIETLLMGLQFEQRSSVGTSIGVGVRDAACFGLWSLARKYSTQDLSPVKVTTAMLTADQRDLGTKSMNVIQLIAAQLIISACLDPSGNLRRGSSAALQELIGRHPDAIPEGISIVQVVDYHAVARRSRAVQQVAIATGRLNTQYHSALLYSLLYWRGTMATDVDSRRLAAEAVGLFLGDSTDTCVLQFAERLTIEIRRLKPSNIGSNASARHGLLLALGEVLRHASHTHSPKVKAAAADHLVPLLKHLDVLTGPLSGRITPDLENILEAVAKLLQVVPSLLKVLQPEHELLVQGLVSKDWLDTAWSILNRCTTSTSKEEVTMAVADANLDFLRLDDDAEVRFRHWLDPAQQKSADFACEGRIVTIGVAYVQSDHNTYLSGSKGGIVNYLCEILQTNPLVETKSSSMASISRILSSGIDIPKSQLEQFTEAIQTGLADYTISQRGDIGSTLRLISLVAAENLTSRVDDSTTLLPVIKLVVKLAAEKLTKVRFQAWACLRTFVQRYEILSTSTNLIEVDFKHQADVSSLKYYWALLQLLGIPDLHDTLILGFISSAAAGTEDISRASTGAVVAEALMKETGPRALMTSSITNFAVSHLSMISDRDDREVVPTIDFLTFVFEQLWSRNLDVGLVDVQNTWQNVQKAHMPASSIVRLEALVRLYMALLAIRDFSSLALDRLTRMLLHKWPKIRSLAADGIFAHANTDLIIHTDWHAPAASNKSQVVNLRKSLRVTGSRS